MTDTQPTLRRIWLPYVFDLVGPFVAYLVVQRFGLGAVWALAAGGCVAGASTVINTIRCRGLDRVGALVLVELAVSIVVLAFVRDPRLLLIRPSFYSAAAAGYVLFTLVAGRPLTFDGAKVMAARGGPARLAAYERAWDRSVDFRRTHALVTAGLGLALLADAGLRVVIVYRTPVTRAAWLSNVPHVAALGLFIVTSAIVGRRFSAIVDREMAQSQTDARL